MKAIHSTVLPESANFDQARTLFLDEVGEWIEESIERGAKGLITDIPNQANYTNCWEPLLRVREGTGGLRFMQLLRDRIKLHFEQSGAWHHGYWVQKGVCEGTEHFTTFLYTVWGLDSHDDVSKQHYLDAAEHIGKRIGEIEPWFDSRTLRFKSTVFGTGVAVSGASPGLNTPDHIRCAKMALQAHSMSNSPSYLTLAEGILKPWAQAVLEADELPIGLLGDRILLDCREWEMLYPDLAGNEPSFAGELNRAESLLSADAVGCLLTTWQRTKSALFADAAAKLVKALLPSLQDPDAGATAAAIREYRQATGSNEFDAAVIAATEKVDPWAFSSLQIDIGGKPKKVRPDGVGKHIDMPQWNENGKARRVNPILLSLAAEILEDASLATRALDLARAYFALAREVFPEGAAQGSSARSVSAVAGGHRRENHAGVITAVLGPMLELEFD